MTKRRIKYNKEINVFCIGLLILLSISCKAQVVEEEETIEPDEYILLNDVFNSTIQGKIVDSQSNALIQEKVDFDGKEIRDEIYSNTLDDLIEIPYASNNQTFFDEKLRSLILDKYRNSKVQAVYFLNVQMNGEMIMKYDFVIVEGFDYDVDLYSFNNKTSKIGHKEIDDYQFTEFVHEFMLNIPYAFEGESLFNNNVQYFTLDRISATGPNEYEVRSVVVPKMLNYQIDIFKAFFDLGK